MPQAKKSKAKKKAPKKTAKSSKSKGPISSKKPTKKAPKKTAKKTRKKKQPSRWIPLTPKRKKRKSPGGRRKKIEAHRVEGKNDYDRLRKSLLQVADKLGLSYREVSLYSYPSGAGIDGQIRIPSPSYSQLRSYIIDIEDAFRTVDWDAFALGTVWISMAAFGIYSPSKEGNPYRIHKGMEVIETFPRRFDRSALVFALFRSMMSKLYRRQKVVLFALRVFVGENKPGRRFS